MKSSLKSFPFLSKLNVVQEISLCTLQEKLSSKHLVSFTTPHLLEFYALVLITEGNYRHFLDFKTYHLKVGDLFLISPNQIHYFHDTEGFDGNIIIFSEKFLRDFFLSYNPLIRNELLYEFYVVKQISLDQYSYNQFINLYNLILNELNREYDIAQTIIIQNLFSAILHNVGRKFKDDESLVKVALENTFLDFKELLVTNISYRNNVKYYADKLNIGIRTLQNVTKRGANKTPKELIDDNLILECKRQLLSSDILIQDTAFELGFEDPSAFTKYFKKNTGLTPIEFKKNYIL